MYHYNYVGTKLLWIENQIMNDPSDPIFKQKLSVVVTFATESHRDHSRKNSFLPYIVHPFDVLKTIQSWKIKKFSMWAACLCHDVLEDCPNVSLNNMIFYIGAEAGSYVAELTFSPDPKNSLSVTEQKAAYLNSFYTKSVESLIIKIADRCCNTKDFLESDPDYAYKYWEKARPLFNAFSTRHEEVISKFGVDVYSRINASINSAVGIVFPPWN